MNKSSKPDGATRMATVLSRIEHAYPAMTPANQAFAKYVSEHHRDLAFATVAQVAAQAGTSPATIVRFAEHLGLSGYAELQALAQEALRTEVDTVRQLELRSPELAAQSLLSMALESDISNLKQALTSISEASFSRAVKSISSARTVHLVGLRSTYGLVRHFEFYLGWIGHKCNVLSPGIGDLPEQLLSIGSEDACMAFSYRRYTRDTVEIFGAAKRAGATTIAITDSVLSPLAEHAEITLPIPVEFPAFFESRTAVLSLINALVLGIALSRRRETLAALKRHEVAWAAHQTYANPDFQRRFKLDVAAFNARARDALWSKPLRRASVKSSPLQVRVRKSPDESKGN